jgi:lysophospholipase L1-like esterase
LREIKASLNNMAFSKHHLLLNAIGLLILGASIALNIRLYHQAQRLYLESNQIRLDPLGLSRFPGDFKQVADAEQTRVVFLGDSRAAAWTFPDLNGYEFIDRGINAQTSAQTVQRFAYHVQPLKPNVVVIQVGINDLKTIALFPDRRASIIANCEANIKQIVEDTKSLGAVAIVTTIFPVGEVPLERKLFWSDQIGEAVQQVNAYIATLADQQVVVLDSSAILADRQGILLPQYRVDELHLNQQGYQALNQELVPLLKKLNPDK